MGLRFHKSFKIMPGMRLNISKSGISTSVGIRGASVSTGSRGTYANLGLPGTGLSMRTRLSGGDKTIEHEQHVFIKTKLVGVTRKNKDGVNRQHILQQMKAEGREGEQITFVPEPDNPKDPNAIMTLNSDGVCLGYLNVRLANDAAAFFKEYPESTLYGKILNFTGGTDDAPNVGCNIAIMTNENTSNSATVNVLLQVFFIFICVINPFTWVPWLIFKSFKVAAFMFMISLLICEYALISSNNNDRDD